MKNKYQGINDMPPKWAVQSNYNMRVYKLWYNILRRCYDITQHARTKGRSYSDCEVCDEWKRLSNFETDIKTLPGYGLWVFNSNSMELDKDILSKGSKIYSKKNCCFIPKEVNHAYMNKCNPDIIKKANEANKTRYILDKGNTRYIFSSEKEACEFLGVKQCTVSSCRRRNVKCKGFKVSVDTTTGAKIDERESEDNA